ncbi:hypothetical protein BDV95DRAFT_562494 [Massariosphaeria phaeospora]|uniref:Rhodopsin domain-containing protein n=1 Tax=Massariosphaeria phaeospora TaxID=100035 RepID=A0A7C8IFA4_9PLEO|nr:hypothetical protein BDV95DRAFT_562494 [Massariosphaeria phaeospora]
MDQMSLASPPAGQKSDFDADAPDRTLLWVLGIVSTTIPFVAIGIRLYVKRCLWKQRISWDDGACIAALLAAISHISWMLKNLDYGLGKHLWDVRVVDITYHGVLSMTGSGIALTTHMCLVRISVLALYQRIFYIHQTSRRLIYIGYGICTIVAIADLGLVIARMVKCSGLKAISEPFCRAKSNSTGLTTIATAYVLTDLFIYMIAIGRLRTLQVNRTKKIHLTVLFAVGLAACLFGLAKLIFMAVHFYSKDDLWYALWVGIFAILEANIALACSCATFLPAFWKGQRPKLVSVGSAFRSHAQGTSSKDNSGHSKPRYSPGRESDEALVEERSIELCEHTHVPPGLPRQIVV